jgi:hypothetical protein
VLRHSRKELNPSYFDLVACFSLDKSDPRNRTKHDDQFPLRVFRGSFLLPHEIESIVLHLTVKWINRSTHSAASFKQMHFRI